MGDKIVKKIHDESDNLEMGIRRGDNKTFRFQTTLQVEENSQAPKAGSLHKQHLKDTTCLESKRKKRSLKNFFHEGKTCVNGTGKNVPVLSFSLPLFFSSFSSLSLSLSPLSLSLFLRLKTEREGRGTEKETKAPAGTYLKEKRQKKN